MRTTEAPPGWVHFSEELIRLAKDRMYFPIEGVYGIMVRDHGSEEKFWFGPTGHYIEFTSEGTTQHQHHSHGSEHTVRQALTEWMDKRDAVRVRGH